MLEDLLYKQGLYFSKAKPQYSCREPLFHALRQEIRRDYELANESIDCAVADRRTSYCSYLPPSEREYSLVSHEDTREIRCPQPSKAIYELTVVRKRRQGYSAFVKFQGSEDVYRTFRGRYETADREEFLVALLDNKHYLLGFNVVSVGSLTASLVHPREVFKPAVLSNAASVLLTHNHPSGDPDPSPDDIEITKRIKEGGEILGIRVLDHVVIGEGRYYSFSDRGRL